MESADKHREIAAFIAADIADAESAVEPDGCIVHPGGGTVHAFESSFCLQQKDFARRSETYGAGAAVEKGAPESLLKEVYLLRYGGLGDIVLLSGLGEAQIFSRGNKILKLIIVHKKLLT